MSLVAGNEPGQPQRPSSGSVITWLIPLLLFGPPLYRYVRNLAAGHLTDEQTLIIIGGAVTLIAMAVIVLRVHRMGSSTPSSAATTYQPPAMDGTPAPVWQMPTAESYRYDSTRPAHLPPPLRFEPIVTGKVLLAGIVLAGLMGGFGLLLFAW